MVWTDWCAVVCESVRCCEAHNSVFRRLTVPMASTDSWLHQPGRTHPSHVRARMLQSVSRCGLVRMRIVIYLLSRHIGAGTMPWGGRICPGFGLRHLVGSPAFCAETDPIGPVPMTVSIINLHTVNCQYASRHHDLVSWNQSIDGSVSPKNTVPSVIDASLTVRL